MARRRKQFAGPWAFAHTDRCLQTCWHKRSTRPILTIEKRRCDCAGGRAQAARVSESDDAPGQAVCRLRRFGIRALQHAPGACTHECNSHFSTLMRTHSVRDASRLREGLFPWTAWEA